MDAEELKHKLKQIFGEQIVFNKDFDKYANTIKNIDLNLIEWCESVKSGEIKYLPVKKIDGIVFIKKIGSSNRCVIIKIINDEFKEVHLADHIYYDRLRKVLGLKKSSV